ncbi:Hint domain-containing protein [Amycolatopsis sp. CA-126428]|uniref:Hint domain-containing protein n=1 Tax=Amycolatopsis sp. CA-126428 TaxID=2073158 RepID=UPI001305007E|nr:Hint domain-containing protein [Amycolatopsis sp. CA-126428]
MADGSGKPIEDIAPGDRVMNAEPGAFAVERHTVTAVHVTGDDRDFDDLTIATPTGPHTVTTTAHHPFWNEKPHVWTTAAALKPGDELATPGNGRAAVTANRGYTAALRTYNLSVEGVHTYYVLAGKTPLLVHNTVPCPAGAGEVWHEGTFTSYEDSFEYHYNKHGLPQHVTPEQYFQDAKAWAEQLAQPAGKRGLNAKRTPFGDGEYGVKYWDPTSGKGGIIAPDGKVVSFWYLTE